jgi:hypothetical protein
LFPEAPGEYLQDAGREKVTIYVFLYSLQGDHLISTWKLEQALGQLMNGIDANSKNFV